MFKRVFNFFQEKVLSCNTVLSKSSELSKFKLLSNSNDQEGTKSVQNTFDESFPKVLYIETAARKLMGFFAFHALVSQTEKGKYHVISLICGI